MVTAGDTHILLDEQGVVWNDDTRVKVVEVVEDYVEWRWSADAVHFQYPDLSLA